MMIKYETEDILCQYTRRIHDLLQFKTQVGLGPSIQHVQIPLQSLATLEQIKTPTQPGVICKLTEGTLDPLIQIIDKDIKENWPQYQALGNTACDWPPVGFNCFHHNSLGPAIQVVFNPAKRMPTQAMSSQFLQENAVGNGDKGFTKVQVDNIHSLSSSSSTKRFTLS
ncbi:hypothetical protein GRJ2_000795500 [Grus japonensis]|uniref:Uncharacterized protein n=1 Tax=Grus japonensis TaxID=30415 RepID=A0ABC9WE51_GRUJA